MNEEITIPVLLKKSNDKFKSMLKSITGMKYIFIKSFDELDGTNHKGIIVDSVILKDHFKNISSAGFNVLLVVPPKTINDDILKLFPLVNIHTVILESLTKTQIVKILKRYIDDMELRSANEQLSQRCKRQSENFNMLTEIGISLSEIRNIEVLFDIILSKSRMITNADAGSIYLVDEKIIRQEEEKRITEKVLKFVHSQNYSFPIKSTSFTIPITKKSIVGYTALTGKILNIPDAHKIPKNRDYNYSFENEKRMKVRNKSIIIVPLKNQNDEIIGVIELFNKKKDILSNLGVKGEFERQVIEFTKEDEEIVASLASQAAVSLENSILYKEIKNIFEGFIKASVVAIEARDPTTSGHSERVAMLTRELAREVGKEKTGKFAGINFKDEDLKIIEYAGLLHDFGKIGVREKVLVKEKKLYPEELDLLKARYEYLKKTIMNDYLKKKLMTLEKYGKEYFLSAENELDRELTEKLDEVERIYSTIIHSNEPTILNEDTGETIRNLVTRSYQSIDGETIPFLNIDEMNSLCILKGSLTESQRKEIESHVSHSFKFLCNIPWTKEMISIPHIVYKHHEKLNGKGYPRGITKENIPIQARMMTITDIYDALTASDRPYKKAATTEKALDILKIDAAEGLIDDELLRVFIHAKIFRILKNKKNVS